MNTQQKGACAEHLAIAALLRNGFLVYRNVTHFGTTDIIAEKDGQLFKIQVKAFYWHSVKGKYRKPGDKFYVADTRTSSTINGLYHVSYVGLVDKLILVDVDSGEVFFYSPEGNKSQVSKSQLPESSRIFPVPVTD